MTSWGLDNFVRSIGGKGFDFFFSARAFKNLDGFFSLSAGDKLIGGELEADSLSVVAVVLVRSTNGGGATVGMGMDEREGKVGDTFAGCCIELNVKDGEKPTGISDA